LRHTFISRLVMKDVNLRMVQELAGHKRISMTTRYAHLRRSTIKQLSRGSILPQRECVVTLVAAYFPEIDRSAGETLRVICTGKSVEIMGWNENS
jgi:hypothetical protein